MRGIKLIPSPYPKISRYYRYTAVFHDVVSFRSRKQREIRETFLLSTLHDTVYTL